VSLCDLDILYYYKIKNNSNRNINNRNINKMKNIMSFKNTKIILFVILIVLIVVCLIFDSFKIENYTEFKISDIKMDYNNLIKKKRNGFKDNSIIFNDYSEKLLNQKKGLDNLEKTMDVIEDKLYTLQNPSTKYIGAAKKKSKYVYNSNHYV
jgi:hypothetical protein